MSGYYDRTGKQVSQEEGLQLLGRSGDRIVGRTQVGDYLVSTVHLVISHAFTWNPEPLIFETMVFKGESAVDEYMQRYSTEEQAHQGHENVVGMIQALLDLA